MDSSKKGYLLISLDFELFWGVVDSKTIENFGLDIRRGRETIPLLLDLFEKYGIHATWGAVGMLFAQSKEELNKYMPSVQPNYENGRLSSYIHMDSVGTNEEDDPLHYAPSLLKEIAGHKDQEVGSHTFCHYYCRENGQNLQSFHADTEAAKKIAKEKLNIDVKSFIFPRNQFNDEYLQVLKDHNVIAVRGNQNNFVYNRDKMISRVFRMIDTYIPICGSKSYYKRDCYRDGMVDLRASVFFRKPNKRLGWLEPLKMWNIRLLMKNAAKKGKIMHIWWHPHNMGEDPNKFLEQIQSLLQYYKELNAIYGMESKNMGELAEEIINEKNCAVMS